MAADVRDWRDKMALRALGGDNKPGVVSRSFLVQSLAKYAMQPGKNELGGVHGLKCITSNQWFPLTTNRLEFGYVWNYGLLYIMKMVVSSIRCKSCMTPNTPSGTPLGRGVPF